MFKNTWFSGKPKTSTEDVKVFIWKSRLFQKDKVFGHASMQVGDKAYISWWPEATNRVPKTLVFPNVYSVSPIRNRTYEDDVKSEGAPPDFTFIITGLDTNSILKWWTQFGLIENNNILSGPLTYWSSTNQNCAYVVATALKMGGGDQFANILTSKKLMWTPNSVSRFAESISDYLSNNDNKSISKK